MSFIYGPQQAKARTAHMWWPRCPIHGDSYQRMLSIGWTYCQGVGWHPSGENWDAK